MNDMNCPHTQNIFLRYLAGPAPSPGASLLAVGAGSGDPAYNGWFLSAPICAHVRLKNSPPAATLT